MKKIWAIVALAVLFGGALLWAWRGGVVGPRVGVQSSSGLYRVEWEERGVFEQYLNDIGIWSERGVQDPTGASGRVALKRIVFELVDEPQQNDLLYGIEGETKVPYRTWAVSGGEVVRVKIYLNLPYLQAKYPGLVDAYLSEGMLRVAGILTQDKTDYRDPLLLSDYEQYIGQGVRLVHVVERRGLDKFWRVLVGEGLVSKARAACSSGAVVTCGQLQNSARTCEGGVSDGASCVSDDQCLGGTCPPITVPGQGYCDPQTNVPCSSLNSCGDNPCGAIGWCVAAGSCATGGGGGSSCPGECIFVHPYGLIAQRKPTLLVNSSAPTHFRFEDCKGRYVLCQDPPRITR